MTKKKPTVKRCNSSTAALFLGVTITHLARWRRNGDGPKFKPDKKTGKITYEVSDLVSFQKTTQKTKPSTSKKEGAHASR